jgi:hypothetical protein
MVLCPSSACLASKAFRTLKVFSYYNLSRKHYPKVQEISPMNLRVLPVASPLTYQLLLHQSSTH